MWVTPCTGILPLAKVLYFMSNFIMSRHYKIALSRITRGDIQSVEQEILPANVKPDMPIQNFD